MNNKTKGALAGVAGVALLAGGTTFALWSDSDTVAGGVITSGNLDVAAVGTAWYDVSADRTDATGITPVSGVAGHVINDLSTWRIVPQDTVEGTYGIDVGLEGDNLQAELEVALAGGAVIDSAITVTYDVYYGATQIAEDVTLGNSLDLRLQAAGTGQAAGQDDAVAIVTQTATNGTADLSIVVTAHFTDQVDQEKVRTTLADLDGISVSLTQVRDGAGFN